MDPILHCIITDLCMFLHQQQRTCLWGVPTGTSTPCERQHNGHSLWSSTAPAPASTRLKALGAEVGTHYVRGRGRNRASCMNPFYSGHRRWGTSREAGAPKRPALTPPCLALPWDTASEQLLCLVFLLQNWDREWKSLCQLPTANRPGRPANWSMAKAFLLSHWKRASRAWKPFSDRRTFGASLLVKWECRGEKVGLLQQNKAIPNYFQSRMAGEGITG